MRSIRSVLATILAGALLAACGTSSVSDQLSVGELTRTKSGVAVMTVGLVDGRCPGGIVTIGQEKNGEYERVGSIHSQLDKHIVGFDPAKDIMQIELPAGRYHIVHWACTKSAGYNRTLTYSIGNLEGAARIWGGNFRKSLAAFDVSAGEVVDIGHLKIMEAAGGAVQLEVASLPKVALDHFRTTHPRLSALMATRSMIPSKGPQVAEQATAINTPPPVVMPPRRH